MDLAEPDSSGNKVISIVVRKIDGADKYTQRLPVEALTDEESDHQLIIDTPAGTIRAPGNIFSSDQVKNGQNIFLTIGKASTADLSDDMMVLVSRALKAAGKSTIRGSILELNQFSDASLVAPYAIESVSSILKEGLIVGSDGILAPNGYATRASAAVFLHKIINK